MPRYKLHINDSFHEVEVAEGTSLLWVIRENLGLTGFQIRLWDRLSAAHVRSMLIQNQ